MSKELVIEKPIELFPIKTKRQQAYEAQLRETYPINDDMVIEFNQKDKLTDDSFLPLTETSFHKQRASLETFLPFDVDQDGIDDLLNVDDLEAAASFKLNLANRFAQLPSSIRKKYNNDPVAYYTETVNDKISELNLMAEKEALLEKSKKDQEEFNAKVKTAVELFNHGKEYTGGDNTASSTS